MTRRRLLLALAVLLVLVGTAFGAAKLYLASGRVTGQVQTRLQDMLGVPVEVGGADVGLTGDSSLVKLRVYEPESGSVSRPWLEADGVQADVSALGLLGGATPRQVRVRNADVLLRFDPKGRLLTKMPTPKGGAGAMPEVLLDGGTLTLAQEGHPEPMVIHGIHADLISGPGGFTLKGTIDDPYWGHWEAGGSLDTAEGAVRLELDSPPMKVTQEKLLDLPFVPAKVWQEFMAEGTTPVKFVLSFKAGAPGVHYRVDLRPEDTTVEIPSIDLKATEASGGVVVEDEAVSLKDVKGRFAGGSLAVPGGDLDFRPTPALLKLRVEAQGVAISELPKSWGLHNTNPLLRRLDGHLDGHADLRIAVGGGGPTRTDGSKGEGVVQGKFGGGVLTVKLGMHGQGKRLRFNAPGGQAGVARFAPLVVAAFQEGPADGGASGSLPFPLDLLPETASAIARGVDRGTSAALRGLRRMTQPLPPGEQPTYVDVNLSVKDADLAKAAQQFGVKLPFPLAGKVSFNVQAGIPVDSARDVKLYRATGTAELKDFDIAGFQVSSARARVRLAGGVLTLEELRGETPAPRRPGRDAEPAGSFSGTARCQISPPGDLTASLTVDRVPLDAALARLPGAGRDSEGAGSGDVKLRAPADRLRDPAALEAGGSLRSDRLRVYGLTLRDTSAALSAERGVTRVSDFKTDLEGAPVTGSGDVRLSGQYPYRAQLALARGDLALLSRLAPDFRPPVTPAGSFSVSADLGGTLRPLAFTAVGTAGGKDVVVEGLRVDDLSLRWAAAGDRVKLTDVKARLYGGEVAGSAEVPVRASAPGGADLRVEGVDARALSQGVPGFPARLEGKVSGAVKGTLTAAAGGRPRALTSEIDLTARRMRLQGIPAERVKGTVTYRGGTGSYRLDGEVLGGTFKVEGDLKRRAEAPAAPAPPQPPEPREPQGPGLSSEGILQLRNILIGRLADAFRLPALAPLRGRLDLTLPFRVDEATGRPTGRGTFTVTGLRWRDATLGDVVRGEVRLTPRGVELGNVTGSFPDGVLRLSAGVGYGRYGRDYLRLELDHVEAAHLLAPFGVPADAVTGPVSLRLRTGGAGDYNGAGELVLTRGRVFGVEVAEWRLPFDFTYIRGDGGQLNVRDGTAAVAQGRALTRATLTWGYGTRLDGEVRFFDAEVRGLGNPGGELGNTFGAGRITGRLTFSADDLRSADDLTATLDATLRQAQATGFPVLQQLIPFLPLGGSASTFTSGDIRGRLARGVFRLQRLTLANNNYSLFAEGNVTLQGRLDLLVVARTGGLGANSRGLALLGLRLPAVGPVPLGLIVDATAFLQNQVVRLRVNGTVRNPTVRVDLTGLLTQEAVRFFLGSTNLPISSIPSAP
jgi:translocation and assembly module TamB